MPRRAITSADPSRGAGRCPGRGALAAAKRREHERYSPVLWRRAPDDQRRHEPFLAACIDSDEFVAMSAEQDGALVGFVLAWRGQPPPPFPHGPEVSWSVDDFVVAEAKRWSDVGRLLLARVATEPAAAGVGRVIVVSAAQDAPKRACLEASGYRTAALWCVRPLDRLDAPAPDLASDASMLTALRERGSAPASEWFARAVAHGHAPGDEPGHGATLIVTGAFCAYLLTPRPVAADRLMPAGDCALACGHGSTRLPLPCRSRRRAARCSGVSS